MTSLYAVALKHMATDLFTHKLDDYTFGGQWSVVKDAIVIFADHNRDGNTFSFHGGPIAGAAGGHPVQLIFWGSWWTTPDGSKRPHGPRAGAAADMVTDQHHEPMDISVAQSKG